MNEPAYSEATNHFILTAIVNATTISYHSYVRRPFFVLAGIGHYHTMKPSRNRPLLLLLLLTLMHLIHASQSDIPDDVEEIEIDVAKLKGMPGVRIVENAEDAYAAMGEERQAEEKPKAKTQQKEGSSPTGKKKRSKNKGTKGKVYKFLRYRSMHGLLTL